MRAAYLISEGSNTPLIPLTIGGGPVVIPLTKGLYALIDLIDWPRVCQYRWSASESRDGRWYVKSDLGYLHRFIMRPSPEQKVDHRRGNGLDNRRFNLRVCTNAQNSYNQKPRGGSSRFKGVHWNRKQSVWVASIHADYGCKFLGHFGTEENAAIAYDGAAREMYGEFAQTNFPSAEPATLV